MKLNIGCGFNRLDGYVNVDKEAVCQPDVVADLEAAPWPWPDSSFTEIVANHALEHMGASTASFLGIIKELWRVGAPDARLLISVPHHLHENFHHDPTHVRVVTPIGIAMFDQTRNIRDLEAGGQETKLGLYAGVDLDVMEVGYDLSEPWRSDFVAGRLTRAQVEFELNTRNNVCIQTRIIARIVKPTRGAGWLEGRRLPRPPKG